MIADIKEASVNENARLQPGAGQNKTTTPVFCYPSPASVKGRVLADLLHGDKLTHMDVWERHGSSRASHHILRLRKSGWDVITDEIESPTSDGRIARIALYSLPVEIIDAAGEIGKRYVAESRKARGGVMSTPIFPRRANSQHQSTDTSWQRYESLKSQLTANARTPAEYDDAIREARRLAGV